MIDKAASEFPMLPSATCVLVLGAYRSDAETIARVLHLQGCALPDSFVGPKASTAAVSRRMTQIAALNDEILASAGVQWDDAQSIGVGWFRSPVAKHYMLAARRILAAEYGDRPLFVLEDPVICRIASFWLDVLIAAGAEVRIVIPVQHPDIVAYLLQREDGLDRWNAALLWLQSVLTAEAQTRGRKRVFALTDDVRADWRSVIDRIGRELDLVFPRQTARSADQTDSLLSPGGTPRNTGNSLPRSSHSTDDLPAWIRDVHEILHRWATDREDDGDHATLDRIKASLTQAMQALAPLLSQASRKPTVKDGSQVRRSNAGRTPSILQDDDFDVVPVGGQGDKAGLPRQADLQGRLASARDDLASLQDRLTAAERHAATLEHDRSDRFKELAELSRMILDQDDDLRYSRDQLAWLKALVQFFSRRPLRKSLRPAAAREQGTLADLKRAGLFDGSAYLERYKDVAAAGMNPLAHYILHGMDEGRDR